MNPFKQSIGIFYMEEEWADYMFKTIVEESKEAIETCSSSLNRSFIYYKDGTAINFIKVNCYNARRYRFTKAYIQNKNLDENVDFVKEYIYPKLTMGDNPECYIINEYEDLYKGNNRSFKKFLDEMCERYYF